MAGHSIRNAGLDVADAHARHQLHGSCVAGVGRCCRGTEESEQQRHSARALQQRQRDARVGAVEHEVPPLQNHAAQQLLLRFALLENLFDDGGDVAVVSAGRKAG